MRTIGSTGRVGAPLSEEEEGCIRKLVLIVEVALPLEAPPLAEAGEVAQGGYVTPSDSKPQKRQCCPCSPAWLGFRSG